VIYQEKQQQRSHAVDLSQQPKGVNPIEIITERQPPVYGKLLLGSGAREVDTDVHPKTEDT
jgi:hypothetical protein